MFSAFSVKDDYNDELKEEITRNSYVLPLDTFRNSFKAKISSKSFHGRSLRSFYGCIDCKLRKKKCDEGKPSCSSCIKRNVTCTYSTKLFKRKPNPSYPRRKKQMMEDNQTDFEKTIIEPVPAMGWTSPSASPLECNDDDREYKYQGDEDGESIEIFIKSILSDFPYAEQEVLSEKSIINISEIPVKQQQEITAMDESQIIQNVAIKDNDDDDLLLRFILNVKSHPGSTTDEELSKYCTSGYDDFAIFKEILHSFLSEKYDHLVQLDELDKFYLASFCSSFADVCSFTSSNEISFCQLYFELAEHDNSVLFALVSLGANYVSFRTSARAQESMENSLRLNGENISKFVRQKQEEGHVDHELAFNIMINLIIYTHIGLLHGNKKEWMQYQMIMERFVVTHFGSLLEFVRFCHPKNAKVTKVIVTNIFSHGVLTVSNRQRILSYLDMIVGLRNSRTFYNEFDSIMGYCAGIYIQVAKIKELTLDNEQIDESQFQDTEMSLINEKPDTEFFADDFNEEDLELHLTFFEVQQISARLYLRLISKNLDPINEEIIDLVENLLVSLQILLKTSFEAYFGFAVLMCRLTVSHLRHERVLQNIIAHIKSHNQVGNLLRICMFLDEIAKYDNDSIPRHKVFFEISQRLDWDLSFSL